MLRSTLHFQVSPKRYDSAMTCLADYWNPAWPSATDEPLDVILYCIVACQPLA